MWSFFALRHGKRKVDGIGALLKWQVKKEQLKPNAKKLGNVVEIVDSLKREANKEYVVHPRVRRCVNKHF
jgi:hypothetical protein